MTNRTQISSTDFPIRVTDRGLGYNRPQRLGRALWGPMWLMALMAFPVAFIIGVVRANAIVAGDSQERIAALGHVVPGVMFIGFAAVFAAVSFAIARILGEFRKGGGEVQELVGRTVHTLKMPVTARIFIVGMMMAMMTILVASVIHFVWAAQVAGGAVSLEASESAAVVLEAVRRLGVAVYLLGITFGLATITKVLRFQAVRVRELASRS